MRKSGWRRLGAIVLIVIVLGVAIVPAAAASPASAPQAAPLAADTIHIVRPGETLYGIAARYGVSASYLASYNGLKNINFIWVGQRLRIPGGGTPGSGAVYYIVKRGDTLTIIAARYGTTVWNLMQLNGISNANRIYVGQRLLIRRGTTPPPPPPPPAGTWHAQYFNTRDLTGGVVLDRRDANINFNWGWSSPGAAVFPDNFSVRWTRNFNMAAGTYRLTVRTDDGVRVWIDDTLVLDEWRGQATRTFTQEYILTSSGSRTFRVEFFEAEGVAEIYVTSQKLY